MPGGWRQFTHQLMYEPVISRFPSVFQSSLYKLLSAISLPFAHMTLRPVLLAQLPAPVVVARMTSGLPARHLPVAMVLMAWRSWKNSRNGLHSGTTIDVISPPLHHLPALIQILSMVVNSTD